MAFPNRNLISKEVNGISADIVDLGDVDDIGPVHFQKVGADQFLFHILKRAISNIVLTGGNEFYIIAHAFQKEDIVLFYFNQLVL